MSKEIEPTQQLEARKDSLSKGIGRINDVYLSDPIRIGQVEIGSSFENTLEIGRTKSAARRAITGLNNKLEQVDNELRVNDEAKTYLNDLTVKKQQLAEMSELVAGGNLPEGILQQHQQEFEELQKRPQNNPALHRAIERIQQEEEERSRKEAETEKGKDKKPLIEVLPDGKVRMPNGREVGGISGALLRSLGNTSEDNIKTSDQLAREVYPGVEEGIARHSVTHIMKKSVPGHLEGTGLELVPFIPTAPEKMRGVKAGYYLKRSEQAEEKADEEFKFDDGEVVGGDVGRLLNKLSPFSLNHIIGREEVLREMPFNEAQRQEAWAILLHKGFKLAELPNLKEPENIGYYVEKYRVPIRTTLLGDTVRYKDEQNNNKQIRLSEKQYELLWELASGEPKLDTDESLKTVAESLNRNLAELTGVDGIVVSLGDENFGYWHKVKDANVSRRILHFPLQSSRQDALKLIFQENPATTKQDIVDTLGPTSGRRQRPHMLNENQAWQAVRGAIYSLKYRNIDNITTEDEADLYKQMQQYIGEHNLADEKGLIDHIANSLGFTRRVSTSESTADAIDATGADSLADNEEIKVDNVDEVEEGIQEEERDSGVATLPRMTNEIETPEFGNLSKLDVALIAERLALHRNSLEPFLGERGVRLIEQSALSELADLVEGQEIGLEQQYLEGLMSVHEFSQLMNEYRLRAFEKAREVIKDPDIDSILDGIGDKNPNVWGLLVNLYEINGVIERSGHGVGGVSIIAEDVETLQTILFKSQVPPEFTSDNVSVNEDKPVSGEATTVFEAPTLGAEPVEPKPSALERADPEIRVKINSYLDEILEEPELKNGPVSPAMVTRHFQRIKQSIVEHAVEEGWVSPIQDRNNRDHTRYDAPRIVTLVYLYENRNLPSRLKKQVQEIAEEEYRKRLKEKENNK